MTYRRCACREAIGAAPLCQIWCHTPRRLRRPAARNRARCFKTGCEAPRRTTSLFPVLISEQQPRSRLRCRLTVTLYIRFAATDSDLHLGSAAPHPTRSAQAAEINSATMIAPAETEISNRFCMIGAENSGSRRGCLGAATNGNSRMKMGNEVRVPAIITLSPQSISSLNTKACCRMSTGRGGVSANSMAHDPARPTDSRSHLVAQRLSRVTTPHLRRLLATPSSVEFGSFSAHPNDNATPTTRAD